MSDDALEGAARAQGVWAERGEVVLSPVAALTAGEAAKQDSVGDDGGGGRNGELDRCDLQCGEVERLACSDGPRCLCGDGLAAAVLMASGAARENSVGGGGGGGRYGE